VWQNSDALPSGSAVSLGAPCLRWNLANVWKDGRPRRYPNEERGVSLTDHLTPMNEKPYELSAQSLCLACGLCCDGTIFTEVNLKSEDEVRSLESSGIKILSDKDSHKFKQPCVAHKKGMCTIYADRPFHCRSYLCSLLERFERSEITQDEALRIISIAVSSKNDIKEQMLVAYDNSEVSFEELFSRLRSSDRGLRERDKSQAILFIKFIGLQRFLDRFFRQSPLLQVSTPSTAKK
jgi:hypothetical protein